MSRTTSMATAMVAAKRDAISRMALRGVLAQTESRELSPLQQGVPLLDPGAERRVQSSPCDVPSVGVPSRQAATARTGASDSSSCQ